MRQYAVAPGGANVELKEWSFRKGSGFPDTLTLAVSIPLGVGINLFSSWLWSKVKGRATRISINRVEVQLEADEVTRVIVEQTKIESK